MKLGPLTPVVIAGGASGLGAAVAQHFVQQGIPVGVIDLNIDPAPKAVSKAQADITDPSQVADALVALRAAQGQERLTVNCAGIAPSCKTVSREQAHDFALFAKVIQINLIGTFNVASQSALGMSTLDPMADGERGVIINTASIAAFEGQIGQIAYAASKGGVASMTLPMARDLAKFGVRIMAIAPGVFLTPMISGMPQEVQDALAGISEFPKRLGNPEEFARLVETIATNTMLNGETIRLDGGTRMQAK
ncbi:MAG: SDR family NAD(P)-dependent oxidoreductase [Colwellia sp.]|nr:SDR family NAD(P)-dependent oxidoreductase [Colwellia sp.]